MQLHSQEKRPSFTSVIKRPARSFGNKSICLLNFYRCTCSFEFNTKALVDHTDSMSHMTHPPEKDKHICGHYITGEGLPADWRGTQASVITSSHSQRRRHMMQCPLVFTAADKLKLYGIDIQRPYISDMRTTCDLVRSVFLPGGISAALWTGGLHHVFLRCQTWLHHRKCAEDFLPAITSGSWFDEERKIRTSKSARIKLRSPFKSEHARGTSL